MFTVFWIFKSPVYKGFSVPAFEDFLGKQFPANAPETLVLLAFMHFRALF
jgi:hypothetical protein